MSRVNARVGSTGYAKLVIHWDLAERTRLTGMDQAITRMSGVCTCQIDPTTNRLITRMKLQDLGITGHCGSISRRNKAQRQAARGWEDDRLSQLHLSKRSWTMLSKRNPLGVFAVHREENIHNQCLSDPHRGADPEKVSNGYPGMRLPFHCSRSSCLVIWQATLQFGFV
jgi:hypothetical protein